MTSSGIGPALIALGGVIIGGGITMATVWWQTTSTRKGRLAELELDLRHKRLLRDEATTQSALLEVLYVLKRFNNCIYEISVKHQHGGDGPSLPRQCTLEDMPELVAIAEQFRDLVHKYGALLDYIEAFCIDVCEAWETIYVVQERHAEKIYTENSVKKSDFCDLGADVACLELMIRPVEDLLEKRLDSILLK